MRSSARAAAALGLLLAAGCAPRSAPAQPRKERPPQAAETVVVPAEGSGPFWEWEQLASGGFDLRVLYPFFEEDSRPGKRVIVFRPLFSQEDEGPGSTRWHFRALWPFILVERTDDSGRLRIFPIIWWRQRVVNDGVESQRDMDWSVMPILWGGSDSSDGRYFALFPVGGMIKGIFGKKYIRFVLFPLWVEAEDPHYHSWNAPWPIFGVWKGPDQSGWRLWPLYGIDRRDDRFRRVFVLWPIGHHQINAMDTEAPTESWAVFPFWLHNHNKDFDYVSVLWPFFGRKHDIARGFVEWHAPWPFFSWTGGKGIRGLKLWPFYSYREAPESSSRFVLWPFYIRETLSDQTERNTTIRSAFVFQYIRKEWVEETIDGKTVRRAPPPTDVQLRLAAERAGRDPELADRKERPPPFEACRSRVNALLWPLWRYKRSELGEKYFTTLEPWFFRGSEVFDRHYGPFVTLYRYQRFADGGTDQRALFNLFELSQSPAQRSVRLTPIFDYRRLGEAAQARRFRLLYGLFGYERRGTAKRVRLLWIPIGRLPQGWEDAIK